MIIRYGLGQNQPKKIKEKHAKINLLLRLIGKSNQRKI
jgi:hypothetical protein